MGLDPAATLLFAGCGGGDDPRAVDVVSSAGSTVMTISGMTTSG
ncbi:MULTISPECIES: hypothetical protein [unclassified Gordonia (in: high G+C Gram-positive bacteria)]